MKGLGPAQNRGQTFDGSARDVVVRVLFRQRPTRCLAVGSEHGGFRVLGIKLADHLMPEKAGRPHILEPVGQCKGRLKDGVRSGLHHVITADTDGIVPGHMLRAVPDNIRNDPHGGARRVYVRISREIFLEDIVLYGPRKLLLRDSLFLCRDDIPRETGKNGTIHGHGDRHLIQRNLIEENLHILHGIYGDTGLPDIADHPGMIGVIPPVGREVKGHRKALLTGGEISPVEFIRFLCRGASCILPDRPWPLSIHGCLRAPAVGGGSREGC